MEACGRPPFLFILDKEDYQSQQTTEKILNLLKSDSKNAQFMKQLINEDDTNKSVTNDNKDNQINEDFNTSKIDNKNSQNNG
ncbi:hypothetical protein [Staphylococcus nepalensis]|uniref:hypothetical protein n=1 Tax=Staphylococcus nepalensis TaxID=214473 RepID=UPI0024B810FD|nr:hypothetical protein [Staphylococcus nepalensis]MDR5650366.1 hypothetical protein [Staphylococcus nepalensis]